MKFQYWWTQMSQKYQWKSSENGHWEINFDTNEIYLITNKFLARSDPRVSAGRLCFYV